VDISKKIKRNEKKLLDEMLYYLQSDITPKKVDDAMRADSDKYIYGHSIQLQSLFASIADNDLKVSSLIQNRKSAIKSLNFTLNPPDNTPSSIKSYVKDFIKKIYLPDLIDIIINARLRSFSVAEMNIQRINGKLYPVGAFNEHDQRFFEKNPENDQYYIYRQNAYKYEVKNKIDGDNILIIEDLINDRILLTPALKLIIANYWTIGDWINKNQLYGKPSIFYVLTSGNTDENSEDYKNAVKALDQYVNDRIAIVSAPSSDDKKFPIKSIPNDTRPTDSFEKFLRFNYDQLAQLILGTGAGTEQERYGTRSTATAKLSMVGENKVKDDMRFVNNILNSLINKFIHANFNTSFEVPNDYFMLEMPKDLHEKALLLKGVYEATGIKVNKQYVADEFNIDIASLVEDESDIEDISIEEDLNTEQVNLGLRNASDELLKKKRLPR